MLSMSDIRELYKGSCVLVSGVTGFLGAILVEKLMRSCPQINTVYVLIREKNGISAQERLKRVLALPVFQLLNEESLSKIVAVEGDLRTENLGLSSQDRATLQNDVSVVLHVAANINFSSSLMNTLENNVIGTQRLLQLAKSMPKIKSFVYVSTAYSNCIRHDDVIEEKIYSNNWTLSELLGFGEKLKNPSFQKWVIGEHPNAYTFSKKLAESLLKNERGDIPVAIVRPSIVLGTLKEPVAGWVDNIFTGQFAFVAGAGMGVFRTLIADPNMVADMVPSDQLASFVIASAYAVYKESCLKVYNFTSGSQNPITWGRYAQLIMAAIHKYPLKSQVLYPKAHCRSFHWRNKLQIYLSHYLPALIIDIVLPIALEKHKYFDSLLSIQRKYAKGMDHSPYFTLNQFNFNSSNTVQLYKDLSVRDKQEFDFDVTKINWKNYLENCVLGVRQYYHKELLTNLDRARNTNRKHMIIYYIYWLLMILILWFILSPFGNYSLPAALFITFLYFML